MKRKIRKAYKNYLKHARLIQEMPTIEEIAEKMTEDAVIKGSKVVKDLIRVTESNLELFKYANDVKRLMLDTLAEAARAAVLRDIDYTILIDACRDITDSVVPMFTKDKQSEVLNSIENKVSSILTTSRQEQDRRILLSDSEQQTRLVEIIDELLNMFNKAFALPD
jgi:hypothetical protein